MWVAMPDSKPPDGSDPPPFLHMAPIARALEEVPIAIGNLITRDKRSELEQVHKGLPALLGNIVRVTAATWKAVAALTLDRQHGALPRRELATAVPPLARTFLESAMGIVYFGEDTNQRVTWYFRAGWVDAVEEYRQRVDRYGSQPGATTWVKGHLAWLDLHDLDLKITPAEKLDPRSALKRWRAQSKGKGFFPNPGSMYLTTLDPWRRSFLVFVNDWFYGKLSQDSHLSYLGLARRGGVLADVGPSERDRDLYRSGVALTALALYLAVLSEAAQFVGLPAEKQRLRKVWEHTLAALPVNELWKERYELMLSV
jgi:hypothetical protein